MKQDVEAPPPFGARLRRFREAAGLTQEELAGRAGLTAKAVGAIERGERKRPYPHTVRSLAEALGLSEDERASLLEAVRRGRGAPGRAEEAPSSAAREEGSSAPALSSSLPTPPTPLLGREKELGEVKDFLARPEVRMLTLTGTGGVGKTRLALEAARAAADFFPDGVAFVALAPLNDPGLVFSTIVRVLGLREAERGNAHETLCEFLRGKRLLLVLDNFEHVLEAAPEVAALIEACPSPTVLVTSRAPLRVRGEQGYPVGPLALPASTRSPSGDEVTGSPSGRLFVERARAASPAFSLAGANASAVARICWRLGGLPLALELAAAKTGFLDPTTLLVRLDRALSSAGWARDVPERQRTMRATLDWSHDLLDPAEQVLFRRLSVFADGFTLEAAEAVGAEPAASSGGVEPEEVLELLGRLAEHSLVIVEQSPDAEARYGMLEPVRQYARAKLEEGVGEAEETSRRHAGYYLALAERAEPELKGGPDQVTWLGRLEAEYDNLRAVLGWSLERGEARTVARLGLALWRFWGMHGHLSEGRRWTEEALAGAADPSTRAKLLFVASTLAQAQFDWEPARPMVEESLRLFRQLGDRYGIALALGTAGLVAVGQERHEEGLALLEESVDLCLEMGEKWGASTLLSYAATVTLTLGDLARARRLAERGLSLAREIGAKWGVSIALRTRATIARTGGDDEHAARSLDEGLALSAEIGDWTGVALCLEGLAEIAAASGGGSGDGLVRAARLWGAAEALLETIEFTAYTNAPDRSLRRRRVAAARARADERAWAQAWAEGRAMTSERAIIKYALGQDHEDL